MRVFVASWFFPPATSSEGIVTYKLLRNSKNTYDVCSSVSNQWGYAHALPMRADNVTTFAVETDEIDEWVEQAVQIFEREYAKQPYDAIMTRTMPPESIYVGHAIKQAHPELPWVASLADPIALNPYTIKSAIADNSAYEEEEKWELLGGLKVGFGDDDDGSDPTITYLRKNKEQEDMAVNGADMLVFPCDALKDHVLATRQRKHAYAVPHTYDLDLLQAARAAADASRVLTSPEGVTTFTFIGQTDGYRSLNPVIMALRHIQKVRPELLERIRVRCIGSIDPSTYDLAFNFNLYNIVSVERSVDYLTSLAVMEKSDWLLHVDASFDSLKDTGGSVFFAGKIADYLATDVPILGITGNGSPAQDIIDHAGGVCLDPEDVIGIANTLIGIVEGTCSPTIDRAYRDTFAAPAVAAKFDELLEVVVGEDKPFAREVWPEVGPAQDDKLISICVPSYNVECTLDRALYSFMLCACAPKLEIIVVNDGSRDGTMQIANAYEQHYPGIIKVIDKENGGHGSTINAALEVATGRYFRVFDGDDWVDYGALDKLVDNIESKGIDVDLISSNYFQVYYESMDRVPWSKNGDYEFYQEYSFDAEDFVGEYFTMASAMFKTSVLRAANFKLQEHTFYVDVEYLLFPIPYTKTVMFAPEPVYRYAVGNAEQSVNKNAMTKRYDHHDRVLRRMLDYYVEHRATMNDNQAAYMRSIFVDHLIPSHFLLSMIWDPDRTRGFAKGADFDKFMQEHVPDMHAEMGKYAMIAKARKCGFDQAQVPEPEIVSGDAAELLAWKPEGTVDKLKQSKLADRLYENETLRNLYRKIARRG